MWPSDPNVGCEEREAPLPPPDFQTPRSRRAFGALHFENDAAGNEIAFAPASSVLAALGHMR